MWGRRSSTARSQTVERRSSSRSLPASGVCEVGRLPGASSASRTDHAATGAALPFASTAGIGSNRNAWRVSLVRLLADEQTAGRGGVLESGGRVHDVAGRERTSGRGVDGDHGLARAHGAAHLHVEAHVRVVEFLDPLEDRETGTDGALRVVDPGERRAEDGHHRIADVLLHDPAVALDPFAGVLEVELVAIADVLGVGAVGARGRAHDVHEQDRDELAFLLAAAARELVPARGTEPRAVGCLCAAATTDHG